MTRRTLIAVTVIASLTCLVSARDAEAAKRGFYAGGSYGQSSFDLQQDDFDAFLASVYDQIGFVVVDSSSSLDDEDNGFEILGGYRMLPWLAFELAFLDLGASVYNASAQVDVEGEAFTVDSRLETELTGLALSAIGIWQLSERFDLYARAGMLFADNEQSIFLTDGVGSASDRTTESTESLLWGAGVGFNFAAIYTARLEYRQVMDVGNKNTTGESDVEFISLGLVVAF